jgi:hypothetical protein
LSLLAAAYDAPASGTGGDQSLLLHKLECEAGGLSADVVAGRRFGLRW